MVPVQLSVQKRRRESLGTMRISAPLMPSASYKHYAISLSLRLSHSHSHSLSLVSGVKSVFLRDHLRSVVPFVDEPHLASALTKHGTQHKAHTTCTRDATYIIVENTAIYCEESHRKQHISTHIAGVDELQQTHEARRSHVVWSRIKRRAYTASNAATSLMARFTLSGYCPI